KRSFFVIMIQLAKRQRGSSYWLAFGVNDSPCDGKALLQCPCMSEVAQLLNSLVLTIVSRVGCIVLVAYVDRCGADICRSQVAFPSAALVGRILYPIKRRFRPTHGIVVAARE